MKRIVWALLLGMVALPATAQENRPLTEDAAAEIAAFYNRPSTVRLSGPTRIADGSEVAGDVASIGGPMVVAGTVQGSVVVINGDLRLVPGGRIKGDVVVAGGRIELPEGGGPEGVVEGDVVVYPETLRFRREDDLLVALGTARDSRLSAGWSSNFGRADLALAVVGSYNRVEGLPIGFGPRIELGRSNPTVLDARLIYRTQSGLRIHPDEFGHEVRLEQYLGGHRNLRLGAGLHRTIDPIELNGLSDTENSLATFLLHRDYRDHYVRKGWSVFVIVGDRTRPLDAGLEYRDESQGSTPARTPWSLLDNDEEWRGQPLVGEGDLRTLRGWLRWDTRNDRDDPATGWLVQVESEQGLEGDMILRQPTEPAEHQPPGGPAEVVATDIKEEFTSFRLDVRRYLRLGPRTRVAVHGLIAGSPDDEALPPQRQHVLGGEGTLPGYDRFAVDCGARDQAALGGFYPYYGCDRSLLLQVEARYAILAGGFSPGRWLGLDFDLLTTPELVLFADAGQAWIEEESLNGRERGATSLLVDAGLGLKLGRIGFYLALPLTDQGDGANFFVRIGPRF